MRRNPKVDLVLALVIVCLAATLTAVVAFAAPNESNALVGQALTSGTLRLGDEALEPLDEGALHAEVQADEVQAEKEPKR